MNRLSTLLLIAVGLLNLYPVIGVFSAEQLTGLYGVDINSVDLATLMRHRAVLLGLIGGFLILAAFRSSLRNLAAVAGLVSMSSFIALAGLSGEIGPELKRVIIADIVGCTVVVAVLLISMSERRKAM